MQIVATDIAMPLATAVARELGATELALLQTQLFSNGQIGVHSMPTQAHVVLFQAFADDVHLRIFELLLALDFFRAAGSRVTAVLPYLPYARSDRSQSPGGPVPARMVGSVIEHIGLSRLITVELHMPQVGGFFRCPVTNVSFLPALIRHFNDGAKSGWTVVSPDLGGAKRAEELAVALGCPMAVIRKHRNHNVRQGIDVLGEVAGRSVMLIDDEINSGQTLFSAAALLRSRGAGSINAVVAHALFTRDAVAGLSTSGFDRIIVSDSTSPRAIPEGVEVVSIAQDIASTLQSAYAP
jgi:ribose-phosphate pyrophosphokinase